MDKEIVSVILVLGYIILHLIWWQTAPRPLGNRLNWIFQPINLITSILYAAATFLALILYFKDYYLFTNLKLLVTVTGLAIFFTGLFFSCWARFYMGKYWAPSNDGHDINRQSKLHTLGPFKYSRNPIYVGLFTTGIGFFLTLNSYLIVVMGLIYWYFNKSIQAEERLLKQHFGESYNSYMKKVPRFLFSNQPNHD